MALAVVIANGYIGHYFAPDGITYTPLVIGITSCLVTLATKGLTPIWKGIFTFIFIALNDVSLKLYAGGTHDDEGEAILQMMLFLGLIPAIGFLIASNGRDKVATPNQSYQEWYYFFCCLLFIS